MKVRMRDMKKVVIDEYSNNPTWPEKVSTMSYRQIAAIYKSIIKRKEKVDGNQLTIWSLMKGKELDDQIGIKNGFLKVKGNNQMGKVTTYILAVYEDENGSSIITLKVGNENYEFKALSEKDSQIIFNILKGEFEDETKSDK